jgi:hypothetical protein
VTVLVPMFTVSGCCCCSQCQLALTLKQQHMMWRQCPAYSHAHNSSSCCFLHVLHSPSSSLPSLTPAGSPAHAQAALYEPWAAVGGPPCVGAAPCCPLPGGPGCLPPLLSAASRAAGRGHLVLCRSHGPGELIHGEGQTMKGVAGRCLNMGQSPSCHQDMCLMAGW